MGLNLFGVNSVERIVDVPRSYTRKVRWLPQIGDIFPNFRAETTMGPISFHPWAEGNWVMLFSHPAAFTPVCTTEIAAYATFESDFARRGVKILGMSQCSVETQRAWHEDIRDIFKVEIRFPMIADQIGDLSEIFGMFHPKAAAEYSIRKSFIVDPSLRIRMIFEYPTMVGRGTEEILRVIDALQTVDTYQMGTPADWERGDDCLLPSGMTDQQTTASYGTGWRKLRPYLKMIANPWAV